jgi:hypothetical protein
VCASAMLQCVVVLAATTRPGFLNMALMRPGRWVWGVGLSSLSQAISAGLSFLFVTALLQVCHFMSASCPSQHDPDSGTACGQLVV